MGNSPVDRDKKYMKQMWGTTRLVTDYITEEKMAPQNDFLDNLAAKQHEKLIREIINDDKDHKKTNIRKESEIFTDESEPETLFE